MKVTCEIFRQNPGEPSRWVSYEVEIEEGSTVLDLLRSVSRQDPGVAYTTHHCKLGICAGCMMVVDGRRRLACRTLVHSSPIRLEPVPGLPVIKDLAVDLLPLAQKGAMAGKPE